MMYINNLGQVTNNSSDLLLTPEQEEYLTALLDNKVISKDTSTRYALAVFHKKFVPEVIYDQTFKTFEDAFNLLLSLEWYALHSPDFDGHDFAIMESLWYYIGKPKWYK